MQHSQFPHFDAGTGVAQDAMLRQLQQQIVALQAQLAALSAASTAHETPDAEPNERSQVPALIVAS